MYIERVPNRKSPPAVLLRESFREDGKVKKRTLANLSKWPDHLVDGLRILLKGGVALPSLSAHLRLAGSSAPGPRSPRSPTNVTLSRSPSRSPGRCQSRVWPHSGSGMAASTVGKLREWRRDPAFRPRGTTCWGAVTELPALYHCLPGHSVVTCLAISRPASISVRRSSQVFWRFSQSCGVVPKYVASRNAVSALMPRWPLRIIVTRLTGTPSAFDRALADSPISSSSSRTGHWPTARFRRAPRAGFRPDAPASSRFSRSSHPLVSDNPRSRLRPVRRRSNGSRYATAH